MKNYTIREISEMFGLPSSTLRYYESEGPFQKYPNPLPDNVYTVMNMLNVLNVSTVSNAQE